jgi:uncharacterized membrane protein
VKRIPGLGFVVVILIVLLVGRVSSSFFMSKLVDLLDGMLERTPGIKFIYKSVKIFLRLLQAIRENSTNLFLQMLMVQISGA